MISTIETSISSAVGFLDDLSKNQLPFALAKGLTMTAQDAQQHQIGGLPGKFILRKNWYGPNVAIGFRVQSATKTNLQSAIYCNAPFILRQEKGGTKFPLHEYLAIPTAAVQPDRNKLIPTSLKPSYLLGGYRYRGRNKKRGEYAYAEKTETRAFILPLSSGNFGIFQRFGSDKRDVRLMYTLVKHADIRARLGFYDEVPLIIQQRFPLNFARSFKDAVDSAK